MAITEAGLKRKRQIDLIEELRAAAVPIFQDLVPVGDIVDVSDSSTIGRLIGIISEPLSDLQEMGEEIWAAFDPESSYGVALDNLVALFGVTRRAITATTADLLVWGDVGLYLPSFNTQVRGVNNQLFRLIEPVFLDRQKCNGAIVKFDDVVDGKTYRIDIVHVTTTYTFEVTATASSTMESLVDEMYLKINSYASVFKVGYGEDYVSIEIIDWYKDMSIVSDGMTITKLRSRVQSTNTVRGAIPQPKNSLTGIATPVRGWDSVNNPVDGIRGNDKETDEELRLRFKHSKFLRAQNIGDSLYSILRGLTGVQYVAIYENDTKLDKPEYGLPPNSFKVVIQGGEDADIAYGIWTNKPLGISCHGNTSVSIRDSQEYLREINFERPINIDIAMKIKLRVTDSFPPNGIDLMKDKITAYMRENFGIGEDVIYSRLFTPINEVVGHQVDELTIGKSGSPLSSANVSIGYNEVSSVGVSDIVIEVE